LMLLVIAECTNSWPHMKNYVPDILTICGKTDISWSSVGRSTYCTSTVSCVLISPLKLLRIRTYAIALSRILTNNGCYVPALLLSREIKKLPPPRKEWFRLPARHHARAMHA
jgi:hypothetical protein